MKDDGALAKVIIVGEVGKIESDDPSWKDESGEWHRSYYRKFPIKWDASFRKTTGEKVFKGMTLPIIGWNDVARKIKADIEEGDLVYLESRLKIRESPNWPREVFAEIEHPEDITKLPGMGAI